MKHPASVAAGDEHLSATRAYYDDFSRRYDTYRGGREPGGYHDLIDDLEIDFLARFARGRDVLEVGCGTGILLGRIREFAQTARGADLSPGMLDRARARGLDVVEASATMLPFEDASFDVACSFKVLPHVRDIGGALREMARVVRPGGVVVAEFYNPLSLRGLVKRFLPAGAVSEAQTEDAVYTRFDTPWQVKRFVPTALDLVASRGARILTPAAVLLRVPVARTLLARGEWALCDSPFGVFGGFWIAAFRKR
jgi:ubiquinone/menaquinone biosynthesis C-methylase UbiE